MNLTQEQLDEPVIITRGDLVTLCANNQAILDAIGRISNAASNAIKGPPIRDLSFTEVVNLQLGNATEKEIDKIIDCLKSNVCMYHQILYGDSEGGAE
jgi:hypothetical protein